MNILIMGQRTEEGKKKHVCFFSMSSSSGVEFHIGADEVLGPLYFSCKITTTRAFMCMRIFSIFAIQITSRTYESGKRKHLTIYSQFAG